MMELSFAIPVNALNVYAFNPSTHVHTVAAPIPQRKKKPSFSTGEGFFVSDEANVIGTTVMGDDLFADQR